MPGNNDHEERGSPHALSHEPRLALDEPGIRWLLFASGLLALLLLVWLAAVVKP